MKLLLITDGITPFVIGGMQKHSAGIAKHLSEKGVDVTLVHCVPYDKKVPTREEVLESLGLTSESPLEVVGMRFPKPGFVPGHYLNESYLYSMQVYFLLKDRLKEFDFIYCKGFSGWYFLKKKKSGESMPPIGVKFHGYEMFQKGGGWRLYWERMLLKGPTKWITTNADFVFSYGGKITELIKSLGIPSTRIIEVASGIDRSWVSPKRGHQIEELNFLFVGRYERRKGIEELTEVIKQLPLKENVRFHFVGPIDYSKRLVREDVTYHGEIRKAEEMKSIFDRCNVLLVPSHSEGMPNVILEGMSRALAIVATDVGAVAALVDSTNGWLIPPQDIHRLKWTIESIINSDWSEIPKKGNTSQSKVIQDFIWDSISDKIILSTFGRL